MEYLEETQPTRTQIGIRLLYTLLYLIVFEVLKLVIQVTIFFQYIYLLITRKHNDPMRNFSNKVATYAYRIIRYATLNENYRPFPFNEFPQEMEKPEDRVNFE